jgi:dienelactone hydrolase
MNPPASRSRRHRLRPGQARPEAAQPLPTARSARLRLAGALALVLAAASPAPAAREHVSIAVTEPGPATLSAELHTPKGPGPYPTVVLMHGCGGIAPNVPAWTLWLQAEGYAVLVVDSFSARGIRNLCADTGPLRPAVRAGDLFAAIAKLRTMSAVDPKRIAAMGLSNGGAAVVAAWRAVARHPDAAPRAMIAFYPSCVGRPPGAAAPPLLILIGEDDDWASAEACRKLAERAREAGSDLGLVVYPGAHHHFDGAELGRRVFVSIAKGGKGATIEYNAKAHADSEKQVRQFLAARVAP